jgi:hypothetical protein
MKDGEFDRCPVFPGRLAVISSVFYGLLLDFFSTHVGPPLLLLRLHPLPKDANHGPGIPSFPVDATWRS